MKESIAPPPLANEMKESIAPPPLANEMKESIAPPPLANEMEESIAPPPLANEMEESIAPPPMIKRVVKGVMASTGPTTGYRNGSKGIVEMMDFKDGWIPKGWFDNPIECSNCTGNHATTTYVKVI